MNENTIQIIVCLLGANDNTGNAIHRQTGIVKSVISKHLNALQLSGIVDYKMCSPHAGRGYTGKCWYLISAPDVFETLLNAFIDTEQLENFVCSEYAHTIMDEQSKECNQITISNIIDKLDEIQPICDMWHPDSPVTEALESLRAAVTKLKTMSHEV